VYPPKSGPSYDACREIVLEALKLNAPCSHRNCSFGGVWDGGKGSGQTHIYATSSFYYLNRDVRALFWREFLIWISFSGYTDSNLIVYCIGWYR